MVSLVALGTAAALAGAPSTSTAATTSGGVGVVTTGLDMPFGLAKAIDHGGFVVAESESGEVTRVFKDGRKHAILRGVPGVAGVAASSRNVFAVIGGPNEEGSPSGGKYGPSRVIRMNYRGKHVTVLANLLRYERRHNPDGQVQLVDGHPVDSISNPFAMTWSRFGLFVADGGANDVLKVDPRTGKVTTFFVPPTIKRLAACRPPAYENNPGTIGCDPVPTGVQVVGDHLFVSTLGAEVPGAGRIYMLDARTGKKIAAWKGLTAPTGVAARKDNTVYFSEVFFGAPEGDGPPPPGFQPSDVGRITRVGPNGHVKHADVTMPTGLAIKDGRLYSTAWSVASFFGMPHAGQVVRVKDLAFH